MTDFDLHAEISAIWIAIQQVNQNQLAIHANVKRLSERLAVHEAATALNQMDEPRALQ